MRVLGLDPGSRRTGFGVVERRGTTFRSLGHGHVVPPAQLDLPHRIHAIAKRVGEVIDEFAPDAVAVEEAFYHESVRSTLVLGHVRGALLVGGGRARPRDRRVQPARDQAQRDRDRRRGRKEQVAFMVRRLLAIKGTL